MSRSRQCYLACRPYAYVVRSFATRGGGRAPANAHCSFNLASFLSSTVGFPYTKVLPFFLGTCNLVVVTCCWLAGLGWAVVYLVAPYTILYEHISNCCPARTVLGSLSTSPHDRALAAAAPGPGEHARRSFPGPLALPMSATTRVGLRHLINSN